ncbi:unnamed protein product [Allacma fusca]|uniref:Pacifastin domain-containing protein n=1 Tax=Allacma fusca TaxID=39272 RepID=A0A8J2NIX6_9HEXA|nr:unnamed protein product [Allacma fusca]
MKTFIYIAILGLASLSLALPQKKSSCAFGEEYNDGCNHCVCHGESGSTCTRLPGCKSESGTRSQSNPTREYIASVSKGHCSLGSEFRKDCNICTCQGDLGYVCTSKECPNQREGANTKSGSYPESPTQGIQETKGKCILGHKFFNGCDLCTCYGEYFGYRCTRLDNCREQTTSIPTRITQRPVYFEKNLDKCPHGKSYYDGYYFCSCRKDNLGYVCTSTINSS